MKQRTLGPRPSVSASLFPDLFHLEEEAVDEIPRVITVQRRLVRFDPLQDEAVDVLQVSEDLFVGSRKEVHEPGKHLVELQGGYGKPC